MNELNHNTMNNSKENRLKRIAVSVMAFLILLMYTGYILYNKPKNGSVNLDAVDYTVISVCIAIMLAVEAVKYLIRRKTGMKDKNNENDAA